MNKVTIIGTGPAGLTAAIYAARGGYEPVIYAGMQHGGQLTTTTEVENFPGFRDPIMGPQLMNDMTAQAERVGTKVIYDQITKVDLSGKVKRLWAGDKEIESQAVIISTGATAKTLGLTRETELMGKGLSTCATCDGFFFRNQKVAVIGGGDSAMEESLYLANICSEVVVIHRRDYFRASNIMVERAKKHPKIKWQIPYEADSLMADEKGVNGVVLKNIETGKLEELQVAGLFYAIGHKPNSEVFLPYVDVDDHGYIKVTNGTHTKTAGVYAAGDIADPTFKQAVTAAGMGCQAALQAMRYLEGHS